MAGDVQSWRITVQGKDLSLLTNRPLQDVEIREVANSCLYLHVTACEVDLHAWFNEQADALTVYPDGTLLSCLRNYGD